MEALIIPGTGIAIISIIVVLFTKDLRWFIFISIGLLMIIIGMTNLEPPTSQHYKVRELEYNTVCVIAGEDVYIANDTVWVNMKTKEVDASSDNTIRCVIVEKLKESN